MNLIKHIVEPSRLLLAWQAPDGAGNRDRHIVANLTRGPDMSVMLRYTFNSPDFAAAQALGFTGHPAFKLADQPYDVEVLPTLMRRLPPRSRPDFSGYLQQLRLPQDVQISDFALLGYSGARLPGDGFSVIHPFSNVVGSAEFTLMVAGTRHNVDLAIFPLQVGDGVNFRPEPVNPKDELAIQVIVHDQCIGYVSRGLLPSFHQWLQQGRVSASVDRINGSAERPAVYLFVEVAAPRDAKMAA